MKTEYKVTSQPLSQRMKELGWNYRTERIWNLLTGNIHYFKEDTIKRRHNLYAPDAIEIEVDLPENVYFDGEYYFYRAFKNGQGKEYVHIHYMSNSKNLLHSEIGLQAEARGKMWCYLREKK